MHINYSKLCFLPTEDIMKYTSIVCIWEGFEMENILVPSLISVLQSSNISIHKLGSLYLVIFQQFHAALFHLLHSYYLE